MKKRRKREVKRISISDVRKATKGKEKREMMINGEGEESKEEKREKTIDSERGREQRRRETQEEEVKKKRETR